jgi:hypothetical protein
MTRKSGLKVKTRARVARNRRQTGRNPARRTPVSSRTAVKPKSAPPQASWRDLTDEFDRWAASDRIATLWWRDDDAEAPSPALDRLLALKNAGPTGVLPLSLAVIPGPAGPGLAARLARESAVSVLQHGWAHANHAPWGERTIELGPHRPAADVLAELTDGRQRLARLFGRQFLPVVVPPWNRIDGAVADMLPGQGYRGLSSDGARARARHDGFTVANVHIDIFRWQPPARFIGADLALGQAVRHLAARRLGTVDPDEPTGLMTHHLQHDAGCWRFLERFLAVTASHPSVRYLPAADIFAADRGDARAGGRP